MAHWKPAEAQRKRALDRRRKKTLYYSRKESGRCIHCGAERPENRVACQACRDRRKGSCPRRRAQRKAAISIKICTACLQAEPIPGLKMCGRCAEYHQDANERFRERARAMGRCTSCFSRMPEEGKTCNKCREINKATKARYRERIRNGREGRQNQKA